jgi:twitching motility protein PilT
MSTSSSLQPIIAYGLSQNASDWHFTGGEPLFLRISGGMSKCDGFEGRPSYCISIGDIKELLRKHVAEDLRKSFECNPAQHLDVSDEIEGERFRLHFEHVTSTTGGLQPSAVLRHIPSKLPEIDSLELPIGYIKLVQSLPPHGLVLVTGTTGSGKSTTLAASINYVNQHGSEKIVCLEAPIEFFHRPAKCLVTHRSVGIDVATFQKGIEAAMRSDPDILLVGEMRDVDTISAALSAAETGHLVFASLHTNNAPGALSRILDSLPEGTRDQYRAMLATSLRAVLAQRLVPKIGGGRVGVFEFMVNTPAVASQIRENKIGQLRGTIKTGKEHHMVTLDQSLKRLVVDKKITRETALDFADNRVELDQDLRNM